MKGFLVIVLMSTYVAFSEGNGAVDEEDFVDWYDCTGKPAGNYRHPTSCNKFMSCSEGRIASQRNCARCAPFPGPKCPEEYLRWDDNLKKCRWASTTMCVTNPTSPTTDPSRSDTTGGTTKGPPTTEENRDTCDPDREEETGYCRHYRRCDPDTRKWVFDKCGGGLIWVPNNRTGVDGGKCDKWERLDDVIKNQYWEDKDCLGCGWWAEECSSTYLYRKPRQTNPDKITIHCDAGLIWDHQTMTCRLCENVRYSDGAPCIC